MPFKCSVPNCRGNYDKETKVHIFSFPTDEKIKQKWINAIPRKNLICGKNIKVCVKHFTSDEIIFESSAFDERLGKTITVALERPRLAKDAVPSIFPDCPKYLSNPSARRKSPDTRKRKREEESLAKCIAESGRQKFQYDKVRKFSNFNELLECVAKFPANVYWSTVTKSKCLLFLNIEVSDSNPKVFYIVSINEELNLNVTLQGNSLQSFKNYKFPCQVTNINEINEILDSIENFVKGCETSNFISITIDLVKQLLQTLKCRLDEKKDALNFIIEQISFLNTKQERYHYSPETLVFASIFHLMSPQSYKFVRSSGNVVLPHPSTINGFSSKALVSPRNEINSRNFLSYAKRKVSYLKQEELFVSLMIDEIHIKQYYDYKAGNIVGGAFDNDAPASSAFAFMLQSLLSQYRDVVHVLPARTMSAETLHSVLNDIICGLEKLGFKVVVVVTDNNSINRKMMSYFSNKPNVSFVYPHPVDHSRPLFFAIDSVHIIKCVRNNWINQKNGEQAMYYPDFNHSTEKLRTASFLSLKKLYEIEAGELLKFGYTLSKKALWPTNLERQKVSLALQIFNVHVSQALLDFGEEKILNSKGTSAYIDIFKIWFDIMNVKTPYKGDHSLNEMCKPLTFVETDKRLEFLNKFLDWLEKWNEFSGDTGHLTRETHSALKITTTCIIELTHYCMKELNFKYILPGKIQTDELEGRFGLYRRLAGTHYHVSIRQIFEIESKLRASSILKLSLNSKLMGNIEIDTFDDTHQAVESQLNEFPFAVSVTDYDIGEIKTQLPLITYLAGYCAHSLLKKLKCQGCKDVVVIDKPMNDVQFRLIHNCDRGGLLYPSIAVINIVVYNYVIVQKLINSYFEEEFLQVANQKHVAFTLTIDALNANEMYIEECMSGHSSKDIISIIVHSSTNTLLKNYCKLKNDKISKLLNERKMKTLTGKPNKKKCKQGEWIM